MAFPIGFMDQGKGFMEKMINDLTSEAENVMLLFQKIADLEKQIVDKYMGRVKYKDKGEELKCIYARSAYVEHKGKPVEGNEIDFGRWLLSGDIENSNPEMTGLTKSKQELEWRGGIIALMITGSRPYSNKTPGLIDYLSAINPGLGRAFSTRRQQGGNLDTMKLMRDAITVSGRLIKDEGGSSTKGLVESLLMTEIKNQEAGEEGRRIFMSNLSKSSLSLSERSEPSPRNPLMDTFVPTYYYDRTTTTTTQTAAPNPD